LTAFIKDILFYPFHEQPGYHLWFLYALFLIFVISYLFSDRTILFVFFSLFMFFVPLPNFLALNYIQNYLFVFSLGSLLAKYYKDINLNTIALIILFLICLIAIIVLHDINIKIRIISLLQNIFGIFGIVSFSLIFTTLKRNGFSNQIYQIGKNSVLVYLLHPYVIQILVEVSKSEISQLSTFFQTLAGLLMSIITIFISIYIGKFILLRNSISGYFLLGNTKKIQ